MTKPWQSLRYFAENVGVTLIPRSTTLRGTVPKPWWSIVILAPLILLAALGARGIRANRESTLDKARADSLRAVEDGYRLRLPRNQATYHHAAHPDDHRQGASGRPDHWPRCGRR
jgi:hypothetical protein